MSAVANSSQFTRVTDVVRVVDADIEAICGAGRLVSIRLATKHGIEVFHVSRKNFNDKAQSPVDHHGHLFRLPAPALEELEADAKQVPITKGAPESLRLPGNQNRFGRNGLPAELRQSLRSIYDLQARGLDKRCKKKIAAALGISGTTVFNYFAGFAAEAAASAPFLKPNGEIL